MTSKTELRAQLSNLLEQMHQMKGMFSGGARHDIDAAMQEAETALDADVLPEVTLEVFGERLVGVHTPDGPVSLMTIDYDTLHNNDDQPTRTVLSAQGFALDAVVTHGHTKMITGGQKLIAAHDAVMDNPSKPEALEPGL